MTHLVIARKKKSSMVLTACPDPSTADRERRGPAIVITAWSAGWALRSSSKAQRLHFPERPTIFLFENIPLHEYAC